MSRYVLKVPVSYEQNGTKHTRYRAVGVVFENYSRETGEPYLTVRLDFPVGATELVAFPPNEAPADDGELPA